MVKNNLDAYRGTYPGRPSLLFMFILQDIADTRVDDPLTVTVTVGERTRLIRIFSNPLILSVIAALGIGIVYYLKVYRANRINRPEG